MELNKEEVKNIIKNYYKTWCKGQAIKVKIVTNKILWEKEKNEQNSLTSKLFLSVENVFLVSGYLEKDGILYKFNKQLSNEELRDIVQSNFNDEEKEVEKIELQNSLKYSFVEDDKIKANFRGMKIVFQEKKNKVLTK